MNTVAKTTIIRLIKLKLKNCMFSGFENLGSHCDEENNIKKYIGIKIKQFLKIRYKTPWLLLITLLPEKLDLIGIDRFFNLRKIPKEIVIRNRMK